MNKRVHEIRKKLKITQAAFGERIGISKSHISSLENGTRNVTDRITSDICREFNINKNWLRTGEGEMLDETPEMIIAELTAQYDLDELDKRLILEYAKLDKNQKIIIKQYLNNVLLSTDNTIIKTHQAKNNDPPSFRIAARNGKNEITLNTEQRKALIESVGNTTADDLNGII